MIQKRGPFVSGKGFDVCRFCTRGKRCVDSACTFTVSYCVSRALPNGVNCFLSRADLEGPFVFLPRLWSKPSSLSWWHFQSVLFLLPRDTSIVVTSLVLGLLLLLVVVLRDADSSIITFAASSSSCRLKAMWHCLSKTKFKWCVAQNNYILNHPHASAGICVHRKQHNEMNWESS